MPRRLPSLPAYFLLAIALTWLFWVPRAVLSHQAQIPQALLMTLHIFGAFGPAAAALILAARAGGRAAVARLFAPYKHWRVGGGWYALALTFRPLIWLAALAIYAQLGWRDAAPHPIDWPFFAAYLLTQPLIVGVGEELGWMGYAFPNLRARRGFWYSTLLLGLLWSLWHLPMFFTAGDSQFGSSLLIFILKLTALRVMICLAFEATGSLLIPALFHVSLNALSELVPLSPNDSLAIALLIIVTLIFSLVANQRFKMRKQPLKVSSFSLEKR